MKNKLIKDMNEETWKKFVAFCKIKGVNISDELEFILKKNIKKNLSKLFKK